MLAVSNTGLLLDGLRPDQRLRVDNSARAVTVVEGPLLLALGPLSRFRGLLGRPPLLPGQGMLLRPCRQVHTFFMGFAIDVLFLDREAVVVELCPDLRPWRASPLVRAACCVLELPAGQARHTGTVVGDRLAFLEIQTFDRHAGA